MVRLRPLLDEYYRYIERRRAAALGEDEGGVDPDELEYLDAQARDLLDDIVDWVLGALEAVSRVAAKAASAPEGELRREIIDVADGLGLDLESSASAQYFVELGRYLLKGEAL